MKNLYRYRLSSTGHSSARFGPCEVCGKHATEVFIQSGQRQYRKSDGSYGWARISNYFGHKECLKKQRHRPFVIIK